MKLSRGLLRQRLVTLLALGAACVITATAAAGDDTIALFVAANGSDSGAGSDSGVPLASLARAQALWRELRAAAGGAERPVVATILGGGTYTLRAPLRLAGEADSNVAIVGSGAGRPALSAGIRVPAWRAAGAAPGGAHRFTASLRGLLPANASGLGFQLHVGAATVQRARLPVAPGSYLRWARPLRPCANPTAWMPTCPDVDAEGFVFKPGDMSSSLHDLGAVGVSAYHSWGRSLHSIRKVFDANSTVLFTKPSVYRFGQFPGPSGSRYTLENVREGLAASRWYFDRASQQLEYWSASAQRPADAVIGNLPSVLVIRHD